MEKDIEEVLMDEYARYLAYTPEQRQLEDERIELNWNAVYHEFMELCEKDEELAKVFDELKEIEKIISFDMREEFNVYSHTVNEFDPECSEDIYVFSITKFKEARALSENWDKEEKRLKDKIEEIRNAKFAPFRESRIAKLERELKLKREIVEYYRSCMAKQEKKDYYLDNADKLINPLKEKYVSTLEKYAKRVLEKHIKKNPNIICKKHTRFISSSKYKRTYDMKVLNDHANRISDKVRKNLVTNQKR